ncbi:MAG: hypothetical protein JWO88_2500 [Frankiales bacterium]|nr:hypothetical protein [Frankiales bacterium]
MTPPDTPRSANAAASGPAGPPLAGWRGARARSVAVPLLGYLAVSLVLWRHLLSGLASRTYGGDDAYLVTWWLRWTPFAIEHGHLPFRTGWLGYPHGVNAMWNASVLLLGVLAWPVTALAGPLVSFNVLLICAPALSGWFCYVVAARLFGAGYPAALAGLLYGFGPYMVGQSAGHLQMTWALFPPLLVGLLVEILLLQRLPERRVGLGLGVAVGLQLLVSEEMLASSAFLAAVTASCLAVLHRHSVRVRAPYVLKTLAWAGAVAMLITAVPLYVQFFGPQRVSGQVQTRAPGADLLSFLLPGPLQAVHRFGLADLQAQVIGANLSEQTAYLGLPLLVLTGWALVAMRRSPVGLLAIPLTVALAMSLGRHLQVAGHSTGIPLPAALLGPLPVVQSMLPVRFSLYVDLFCALLLAAWLTRLEPRAPVRRARAALLLAAGVLLLPASLPSFPVSTPPFFTDAVGTHALPADATVFVAPYPGPGAAGPMLWQAEGGLRFRMVGGYFVGPDARGRAIFGSPPGPTAQVVSIIQKGGAPPAADSAPAKAVAAELAAEKLDAVVVGPMPRAAAVAAFFRSALHKRATRIGGVWLIRLSP